MSYRDMARDAGCTTEEEIRHKEVEMKDGCELDALVAEKVMGAYWTERENVCRILWNAEGEEMVLEEWYEKDWVPSNAPLPTYSTHIAAAWMLVEKLEEQGLTFILWTKSKIAQIVEHDIDGCYLADENGDSMAHAICLAALKAVEVT